jgi:hypothetical protein
MLSPNFASWLQGKTAEVYRIWRKRYIEVICGSDVRGWVSGVDGVEAVDLFMRISQELVYALFLIVVRIDIQAISRFMGVNSYSLARSSKRPRPMNAVPNHHCPAIKPHLHLYEALSKARRHQTSSAQFPKTPTTSTPAAHQVPLFSKLRPDT